MNIYYFILSVFVVLHLAESVKVSVYYEALCYDSTRFIALQLYPNYSKLKNHMQLEFIPYGKATHNYINNKWIFDCQHGPNECRANKYQSCALALNNGQDKDVIFVNCIMRERNPSDIQNIEKCAKRANIDWNKVSECGRTVKGDELLARNGNKTNDLEPNISFVPTVVYDDKFDDYLQENSLVDFFTVVCTRIKGEKPHVCNNRRLPPKRNFQDYFYVEY